MGTYGEVFSKYSGLIGLLGLKEFEYGFEYWEYGFISVAYGWFVGL